MFQQGNIAFIDEDFDAALHLYSDAIEGISRTSDQLEIALAYSFRAAVHLKLKNFQSSLDDCNAALKLNVIKTLNNLIK